MQSQLNLFRTFNDFITYRCGVRKGGGAGEGMMAQSAYILRDYGIVQQSGYTRAIFYE
jgi:hypothetical protein